jgi:deoxyadenosine/deoxycytidine kinase
MRKQKIIVYDGMDRCGKTEMAKELSHRIGVPYFKNGAEHTHFLKNPEYFINAIRYVDTYFTSYLESSGASVILDRAYPSEWVYSQALNRPTDMGILRELDERHCALGTRIIIPYRQNRDRVVDDYEVVNKNIQKIHDLYHEFFKWTKCKTLMLQVDHEDLELEMKDTMQFLEETDR